MRSEKDIRICRKSKGLNQNASTIEFDGGCWMSELMSQPHNSNSKAEGKSTTFSSASPSTALSLLTSGWTIGNKSKSLCISTSPSQSTGSAAAIVINGGVAMVVVSWDGEVI